MRLIYNTEKAGWINGVPTRDLEAHEVQALAHEWGLSLAETEGLLIARGYYRAETSVKEKRPAKLHKPQYPKDYQSKSEHEQE